MTVITEPGVYDMPADVYHADPVPGGSLSSSGARRLLPPGCPALYHHERQHGGENRPEFDLGTAAHKLVLGVGPTITEVKARDWRTKAAQEARDAAYATGAIPLLTADYQRVAGMANALAQHPIARALLNPDRGKPEQAIFWQDEETGVWRRALVDWLPELGRGRPIVVDYKTTKSAEPRALSRAIHSYGYHQQDPWYRDAAQAVGYPPDTAFVFLFQEKTPPYVITPVQLDDTALAIGRDRNRKAIEIYRDCTESGIWPGYDHDFDTPIGLPAWAEHQHFEETA